MFYLVLKQLLTMMFIVIGGFICAKAFKIGEAEEKFMSKLLLYFINPCLVITSFNLEFDALKLKQFGFVALVSLVIHGVMVLVAILTTLSKNPKKVEFKSIDRVATVFTNCGFVGIPLIRGVFGDEGVFYLMGYLVIFNVLLWTYGYYQMSGTINLKKLIVNPNILAVIFGILIFCSPWQLPAFIARPISMIGDINTAASMILIGILFADFKLPEGESKLVILQLIKITFVRLVLCVAVNLLVLYPIYLLFGKIPDIKTMIFVTMICSACPSATSVPSLSCIFDKNTSYASLVVSISSLFCILSVPAFVALGELLIK